MLFFTAACFFLAGLLALIFEKVPGMGSLPGDIVVKKGNFTFFAPLTTCLLLSGIITVILMLIRRH
ncbi:MAG TPA: DUF2905 domain-containing protein [Candidatus Omnitrophota bacterium]|nr:DUF2905 domain-containing protein [Candidatus Omnitrophota bacterium]